MDHSSSDDVAPKRRRVAPEKPELWDQVELDSIIYFYDLKLRKPHKLPPKYTYITDEKSNCFDESKSLCAEDCLEMLLSFICTKNCPSAKAVIDEVLKGRSMRALGLLLMNQSFNPTKVKPEEESSVDFLISLDGKITAAKKMFKTTSLPGLPVNKKIEHATMTDFFVEFCLCIIRDGTMMSGTRRFRLAVEMGSTKMTRKADPIYQQCTPLSYVTAIPNLMIGQTLELVSTPVEIYAPHIYERDTLSPYHCSETETSDEEYISLPTFLENIPPFRGAARSLDQFKYKITVQLLLQLLGSSRGYIDHKIMNQKVLHDGSRSYIGIFAHRFDVYIIKIECHEVDLFSILRLRVISQSNKHNPVTVQFFPVPLDLSNANHAIAFAVFLKYYRNFYKVQN